MKKFRPTIILVRPQLPQNIGMVARVMQNFSLKELILINPRKNWLSNKSINSAKKAKKIIEDIKIFESLDDALKKFTYVIATTNRNRFLQKISSNNFLELYDKIITNKKVAIIFGPENSGLSNKDLILSDLIFTIDTSKNNNSLNLSHAVTIICQKIFEFNQIKKSNKVLIENDSVNKGQLSKYFDFLFDNLDKKNFFVPKEKTKSMKLNIYNIFLKSRLTNKDLQTLWGITKKLIK